MLCHKLQTSCWKCKPACSYLINGVVVSWTCVELTSYSKHLLGGPFDFGRPCELRMLSHGQRA